MILVTACKKKEEIIAEKAYEPNTLNQFFETYILNKDIRVTEAKFEGRDTTTMYADYTFKLYKNTYYDGPFEARNSTDTFTGTWQCNEDYSKLSLKIGGNGALDWVDVDWKFKSKSTTTLELIPWFNTDGDRYVKFVKQ
ncbi:MAG: hypothetical protein ACKOXF_06140 [Chitinophagaceae bacterium]